MSISRRRFGALLAAVAAGAPAHLGSLNGWARSRPVCPFSLSVMLWTLRPRYDVAAAISLVARAGYRGFELVDEDKQWSDREAAHMLDRARQLGLVCDAVSGLTTGFAAAGAGPRLAAELSQRMDQAERLHCRRIILLSGKRDASIDRSVQHAACIETLQHAGALAAQRGFELLIEPIDAREDPSSYLTHVAEAFQIARAANRPTTPRPGVPSVKVLYDLYHEARSFEHGEGVPALLNRLRGNIDLLGLVHVAGLPGRHTPTQGSIDYRQVYQGLMDEGYRGWLAMEFLPQTDALRELAAARSAIPSCS